MYRQCVENCFQHSELNLKKDPPLKNIYKRALGPKTKKKKLKKIMKGEAHHVVIIERSCNDYVHMYKGHLFVLYILLYHQLCIFISCRFSILPSIEK